MCVSWRLAYTFLCIDINHCICWIACESQSCFSMVEAMGTKLLVEYDPISPGCIEL